MNTKSTRLKLAVAALGLMGLVGCETDNESNMKKAGNAVGKTSASAPKSSAEAYNNSQKLGDPKAVAGYPGSGK